MGVGCVWIVWVFGCLEVFPLTRTCNIRAASVSCFVHTFYLYVAKGNGFYANWKLFSWPKAHKVLVCRTDTSPQPPLDLHGANMQQEETLKIAFLCCSTLFGLLDPTMSTAVGKRKECQKSGSSSGLCRRVLW